MPFLKVTHKAPQNILWMHLVGKKYNPPPLIKKGWKIQICEHYISYVGVMQLLFLYLIGMWFGEDKKQTS